MPLPLLPWAPPQHLRSHQAINMSSACADSNSETHIASMQQRQFAFSRGEQHYVIELLCREPPEAQAGKTLTWQLYGSAASHQQTTADASGRAEEEGGPTVAPGSSGSDGGSGASNKQSDLIGLDIWPASIALCRYLVNHQQLVAGHAVLELGAGQSGAPATCTYAMLAAML